MPAWDMIISWLIGFVEWSGYFWTFGLVAAAIASFIYIPKIGTHMAIILLMVAAGTYLLRDSYSRGQDAANAVWDGKLKVELDRRDKVLETVQRQVAETTIAYETERQSNERLQRDISLLPVDRNGGSCLSPDIMRKLQGFRGR